MPMGTFRPSTTISSRPNRSEVIGSLVLDVLWQHWTAPTLHWLKGVAVAVVVTVTVTVVGVVGVPPGAAAARIGATSAKRA